MDELTKKWYKKLANSGFVDIEDEHGNLTRYDNRTNKWEMRDQMLQFHLTLNALLSNNRLPRRDRMILQRYSNGQRIGEIAKATQIERHTISRVIKSYAAIICSKIQNNEE